MIWLNGKFSDTETAISANDRGLLLGEAVFETVLVENGGPAHWAAHMARLWQACAVFGFATPYNSSDLHAAAVDLLAQNAATATRGVIRITVTGGDGGRGLVPITPSAPNWLMQTAPAPTPPAHVSLHLSRVLQAAGQDLSPVKSTNYAAHILARRAALGAGADDAVLVNQHGRVTGTSAGNIFALLGDALVTPHTDEGALPGITRARILALSEVGGTRIATGQVTCEALEQAAAVIICNAVIGVVPASLQPKEMPESENIAKKIRTALTARI
jgi:branched-subunit amino acid aminotransferase/4-amino-4-deoxychorismate lyase